MSLLKRVIPNYNNLLYARIMPHSLTSKLLNNDYGSRLLPISVSSQDTKEPI